MAQNIDWFGTYGKTQSPDLDNLLTRYAYGGLETLPWYRQPAHITAAKRAAARLAAKYAPEAQRASGLVGPLPLDAYGQTAAAQNTQIRQAQQTQSPAPAADPYLYPDTGTANSAFSQKAQTPALGIITGAETAVRKAFREGGYGDFLKQKDPWFAEILPGTIAEDLGRQYPDIPLEDFTGVARKVMEEEKSRMLSPDFPQWEKSGYTVDAELIPFSDSPQDWADPDAGPGITWGYEDEQRYLSPEQKETVKAGGPVTHFEDVGLWAVIPTLEGMGILPNGEIVYGGNTSEAKKEYPRLLMEREKPGADRARLDDQIEAQIRLLKKANDPDFTEKSMEHYKERTPDYYQIPDATRQVNDHMLALARQYRAQAKQPWFMTMYPFFFNLVRSGSLVDLKDQPEYQNNELFVYDGEIVSRDALGNIAFGYLGRYFGMPGIARRIGAGYAQITDTNFEPEWFYTWFDDPRDYWRVRQGEALYNRMPPR
jgi:hypothetical protein